MASKEPPNPTLIFPASECMQIYVRRPGQRVELLGRWRRSEEPPRILDRGVTVLGSVNNQYGAAKQLDALDRAQLRGRDIKASTQLSQEQRG